VKVDPEVRRAIERIVPDEVAQLPRAVAHEQGRLSDSEVQATSSTRSTGRARRDLPVRTLCCGIGKCPGAAARRLM
jgi:hypothetical protein